MPSNLSRRARRMKQTRFTLDPVEPNSPAASPNINPARIHYQPRVVENGDDIFVSGKKYAVVIETRDRPEKNSEIPFKPPMPLMRSSQVNIPTLDSDVGDDSDSDAKIIQTRRRNPLAPRSASRAQDLNSVFQSVQHQQLPLGYDGADDDSSGGVPPKKRGTPMRNVSVRNFLAGGSSYNAPIPNRNTPSTIANSGKSSKKTISKSRGKKTIVLSDSDDYGLGLQAPRKTQPSSTRKLSLGGRRSKDSPQPTKAYRKRSRKPSAEDNDGNDELPDLSEITVSSGKERKPATEAVDSMELDEEDGEVFVRSSRKRPRPTEDKDEEDEDPISPLLSKRKKAMSTDFEESDTSASMARTLQKKVNKRQSKRVTRRQQPRKAVHRTAAQKRIELFRRRRAGEDISDVTSTESEGEAVRGLYDSTTDSEQQALSEFDDEENDSGDEGIEKVRESLRAVNRNHYDDEFVVDDSDEALGVPGHGLHSIPLQFTHQAHKPLREHFRDSIDWMVQRKINPGFSSADEIYVQAFRKLGDEVSGYANSKFMSSTWAMKFNRALCARPYFTVEHIGADESNKCGACNRSGHPATFRIMFSGKTYDKDTLEELDNNQDVDSDHSSVNSKDEPIVGEDTTWLVGRFCKANAETAHALLHWKHHMNDWVIDRIKAEGHMDPEKLAERADWSKKRLRRYANEIVDDWVAKDEVARLYHEFKNTLDKARNHKQGRWG